MLTSGQVLRSLDAGLVPQEVVSGSVFNDYNANGQRDPGDPGGGGWVVFLDDDGDGQLDSDERSTSTDGSGRYQFVGALLRGTQRPTLLIQDRWFLTWPLTNGYVATVQPGGSVGSLDFGVFSDTPVAFVSLLSAANGISASGAYAYYAHRVASDDEGDYVIVRESWDTRGTYIVYLDLYDAAGSLRKSNWVLSASSPIGFDVAMDADGNSAIVYDSSDSSGLYLRRYDSTGQPLGGDITLGTLSNNSTWPTIAMNAVGDGVVAWWGEGKFYLRRFDAAGNLTAAAIRLSQSDVDSDQGLVQVDMNANGECVAFWREKQPGGFGVYARLFDASGTPRGDSFCIDSSSDSTLVPEAVAIGNSGDFAAAWWNAELRVQRYSASAQPQGAPGHIAGTFDALDIDPDGNIAVTRIVWTGGGDDDFCSLYLQLFNPAGQPLAGMWMVCDEGYWIAPALAVTHNGNLNVVWHVDRSYYARRYHVADAPDPAIPGTLDSDTYCLRRARDNVLLYTGPAATGQPSASYLIGSLSTLTIDGLAADDSLQIDFSGGSPIPIGGISFRGGDGADSVIISGTHDYDGLSIEPRRILYEDTRIAGPQLLEPISCDATESILLGRAGADVPLAYLRLAQMARLQVLPGCQVLRLGSLSIDETATLDLSDNDMIVTGGDIDAISSAIKSRQMIGKSEKYTALAAILNDKGDKDHTPIKTDFAKQSVLARV